MLESSTETLYEPEDPLSASMVQLSESSLSDESLNTSLPAAVFLSQSSPHNETLGTSLPTTGSQLLFPDSSGLFSYVERSPRDAINLPNTNITDQLETNTDITPEYDQGLNSGETLYESENIDAQDTAVEFDGTRNRNGSTCFSNDYMKENGVNGRSNSSQLLEDNLDACFDTDSERFSQGYEQSVNSVMFGSTNVASDESPDFLLQVCQETLSEDVNDHLKQVKVENDCTISPDSLNSSESDPYLSNVKLTPHMSTSIAPECNTSNISGSADNMFDLSPYIAVLDWNNNNINLPEKFCENEHEEVEIYIFDGAEGSDSGIDVECFLQASENGLDYVPVGKDLVTSADKLNMIDGCVLQGDVNYGGGYDSTCNSREIPDVKVEMNVDCDELIVSKQNNDEGHLLDMKYIRDIQDIKQEVCAEHSETVFLRNMCNTKGILPVYSESSVAEFCPGQFNHFNGENCYTYNDKHDAAYHMDSLERKNTASFNTEVDGVEPCLNASEHDSKFTYSVEASVNDPCTELKKPESLLKSLNSLVESKRKVKKRKGKELCVKLSGDLVERDIMLKRLKTGKFGKRPHVVRITENGVLLDVTREYMVHLPCRIRH